MNEYIDTKYIILNAERNEAYALCYTSLHLIEPLISVLSFNFSTNLYVCYRYIE